MIHEVTMVSATCDNCGESFEESHTGWSAFVDNIALLEEMDSHGWHVETDKHYCPCCFKIDDEDNLVIIPLPPATLTTLPT